VLALKSQEYKPPLFKRKKDELSLSGPAFIELLRAVLGKGVPFRFQARGFSMSPFIKDGDLVTVSPLLGSSPGLGDVVAFIQPGTRRLAIHRIIGKKGSSFFIKGDNTYQIDGLIPETNILGYVTRVERDGKKVSLGLGLERFFIALLARRGLLFPFLLPVWKIIRPFIKKWVV
jgi:hypothetical protein